MGDNSDVLFLVVVGLGESAAARNRKA